VVYVIIKNGALVGSFTEALPEAAAGTAPGFWVVGQALVYSPKSTDIAAFDLSPFYAQT
jgi:hypothetical protein